jgi:hypothetical protein
MTTLQSCTENETVSRLFFCSRSWGKLAKANLADARVAKQRPFFPSPPYVVVQCEHTKNIIIAVQARPALTNQPHTDYEYKQCRRRTLCRINPHTVDYKRVTVFMTTKE